MRWGAGERALSSRSRSVAFWPLARYCTRTVAPARAKSRQQAAPIPPLPPVTKSLLQWRSIITALSCSCDRHGDAVAAADAGRGDAPAAGARLELLQDRQQQ